MLTKLKTKLRQSHLKTPWFYSKVFLTSQSQYISGSIIDVGCGTMKYKKMLLSLPGVRDYTSLDFYAGEGVDIKADLNRPLPIATETYETAICISVIEHLLEPQQALNEMARILKPGGFLLLSSPWVYPFHAYPNDYFRYSLNALKYLLEKAGLEIVYSSSTGGKARIISALFTHWFPLWRRFLPVIDGQLAKFSGQAENERQPLFQTPSYHIVARKK